MATAFTIPVARVTLADGVPTTLYTVAAGHRLVVRDVWFRANGAVGDVFLYVTAGEPRILGTAIGSLGTGASYHWDGRQAVEAGEVLHGLSQGADCQVAVTGYLLTVE